MLEATLYREFLSDLRKAVSVAAMSPSPFSSGLCDGGDTAATKKATCI